MNSIGRSKELQQPPGYDPDWARAAFDRFLPVVPVPEILSESVPEILSGRVRSRRYENESSRRW